MKAITWKKGPPTKPGIYLRNNPASSFVVRQDVFELDDKLFVTSGDGSGLINLATWNGGKTFWWYGPIPRPPIDK